jgi:uncharacterized RDD family membrane protein YckC
MKCPKCGYLGFETGDRCRNCGYDFSLAPATADVLDLVLDPAPETPRPPLDLDRIIGVPEPEPSGDLPLFSPPNGERTQRSATVRRTGTLAADADDAPLITTSSRPRPPLVVRRATGEIPRARTRPTRPVAPQDDALFETPPAAVLGHAFEARSSAMRTASGVALASPLRRVLAGLLDVLLLSAVDAVVVYLTLRLLGLTTSEISGLPLLPLLAFFLLLNGGYFVAFTAVGGQSIGKMALGIKVISQQDSAVPVGQATLRTLAYIVSALPLGAGFLPGVFSPDRLALHDRLAHTRVVRPS